MLNKKKIDRKLRTYIRHNLSKGHSRHAVKKVLVSHGYDESYVDGMMRKHQETQFVKKYALAVSAVAILSLFLFNFFPLEGQQQNIVGLATTQGESQGCCIPVCQETSINECYGKLAENKQCSELNECIVGCCIDKEGYCLTNYLYDNCVKGFGKYVKRDCSEIISCRNVTDASYLASLYDPKSKRGAGVLSVHPVADYYGSSFNIKYYLYDKMDVLAVTAVIKDSLNFVEYLVLFDDGSHNDGAANDNVYGNNWLSSKLANFDGFKRMEISIIIKFKDETEYGTNKSHNIVVLNKNKCLPIFNEWADPNERRSLIFAANHYANLSDGYGKFAEDVNNAVSMLFSADEFAQNRQKFNVYRLEQSLQYADAQALLSAISGSCPAYSNQKDTVIILDKNEDYCVQEDTGLIRVNPQILFYNNISDVDIDVSLASLCDYIVTPKKIVDEILNLLPPRITIHTPTNTIYNTSIINLNYSILSQNMPIAYTIYLEGTAVFSNVINAQTPQITSLALVNGTNPILIEATDTNDNTAFAQFELNVSIK